MKRSRLPTAQRRQQLADAALKLLATEGARAVTVKNIASVVGITEGALYRHYPNTAALFDAAIERFDESMPSLPDEALEPRVRLRVFFIQRLSAVQENPEVLGLTMGDRLEQLASQQSAQRLKQRMKESMGFLQRALKQAQDDGELPATAKIDTVMWMFTGAMRGAGRSGVDPADCWRDVDQLLFQNPKHPQVQA